MRTLLSALVVLSLSACGSSVTELRSDAAPGDASPADASAADASPTDTSPADASPTDASAVACDPHRAPCRVTLACQGFERCEAVSLATGRVESFGLGVTMHPGDLRVEIGRYLILTAPTALCRFGATPGSQTSASFATLNDVPTAQSGCSWDMGRNLLCGVNTARYEAACVGAGLLVRDGAGQLYRLRVVADRAVSMGWQMELEWVAIDG